jgi:hypothetical protein
MKNLKDYKLITGVFSPSDAKEILLNVYNGKIQFHQMKNFSSKERFGKEDKVAIKRIPQLKKSLEKLIKQITKAEKQKKQINLSADIFIEICE